MKSSLKLLPFDTARTAINSFVISSIDYCNSLLANSSQCALNQLQRVMNAAARLVCHCGRLTSVSGLLRDRLHCFVFCFKAVRGPLYQIISVSSANQTLNTLLVLDSARQHITIS